MAVAKYWDGTRYVPLLGGIDQGTADARYVKQAGDTMTGRLLMGAAADIFMVGSDVAQTVRGLGVRAVSGASSHGLWALQDDGSPAPLNVMAGSAASAAMPRSFVESVTAGWTYSGGGVAQTIDSTTFKTIASVTIDAAPVIRIFMVVGHVGALKHNPNLTDGTYYEVQFVPSGIALAGPPRARSTGDPVVLTTVGWVAANTAATIQVQANKTGAGAAFATNTDNRYYNVMAMGLAVTSVN